VIPKPSSDDLLIGALTLYGEARGDTQEGRVAVAHTILNRCKAQKWWGKSTTGHPDHSIAAVCKKPSQFSCWNKSDPNYELLTGMEEDGVEFAILDKHFRGCLKALIDALDGFAIDQTQGCTHYLTTSLHRSGKAPDWSKGLYAEFGKHRFFKGID
jgi:N-acetylmuramoyl-L-alanine amidase